jgi:hypothetical protein
MLRRFGARLGALLRRLADRLAPLPLSPSVLTGGVVHQDESEPVPVGATTFEVRRLHEGATHALYHGPSGAKARDRFLRIKRGRQPGVVQLVMDGQIRDFHTTPPE